MDSKLLKLLDSNDYVITTFEYNDERIITLKSCEDFLDWFLRDNYLSNVAFYGDDVELGKMDAMYSFLKYYLNVKQTCEEKMNFYNDIYLREDNVFVKEAMEQFVSSNKGGKYLRASLVALGYHSFGGKDDNYLSLSMALEIFQTSILVHDDIIDNAVKRRGMDTIPIKYKKIYSTAKKINDSFEYKKNNISNSMALCLGDVGFYLANQIIINNYFNNPRLPFILDYYNEMAIKTCKGEMIDIMLPFFEEFYGDVEELENNILEIFKLKTAWYSVVGPYVLGSILAGLDMDKVYKLEDALINLGIAFQIKDDLLGIYGDEVKMGKSLFSDASEFKQTLLYSYTVGTSYKEELLKLYGKNNLKDSDLIKIQNIFDKSGARDYSVKMMDRLFKESFDEILNLDFLKTDKKKLLLGFAEFLKVRSK